MPDPWDKNRVLGSGFDESRIPGPRQPQGPRPPPKVPIKPNFQHSIQSEESLASIPPASPYLVVQQPPAQPPAKPPRQSPRRRPVPNSSPQNGNASFTKHTRSSSGTYTVLPESSAYAAWCDEPIILEKTPHASPARTKPLPYPDNRDDDEDKHTIGVLKLSRMQLPYPVDPFEAQVELSAADYDYSQRRTSQSGVGASQISTIPAVLQPASVFNGQYTNVQQHARRASSIINQIPLPGDVFRSSTQRSLMQSLDLPQLPEMTPVRPSFSAEQLTISDLCLCPEFWLLSELAQWIAYLLSSKHAYFSTHTLKLSLAKLFCYGVQTLSWADAESYSNQVLNSLANQGFLSELISPHSSIREVAINQNVRPNGVFALLCGQGCYSRTLHHPGICYSSRCLREERLEYVDNVTQLSENLATSMQLSRSHSLSLPASSGHKGELEMEWATYWGISPTELGNIDRQQVKLQYAIHELITSEALYVNDLSVYIDVYGEMEHVVPPLMAGQTAFCNQVFGRLRPILEINKTLLGNLRTRQQIQGPYILQIADIFLAWAQEARSYYLAYAEDYLPSDQHLRQALQSSARLEDWMAQKSRDPLLRGVPHSFYFSRVLPRLARYGLLMSAVIKATPEASDQYQMLESAISAVNKLTKECDSCVAKIQKAVDVQNLKSHIVFKDDSVFAELDLGNARRKLIKRGLLYRRSGFKTEWVPTQALLLDNFFILSKSREGANGMAFYVTKKPINLEILNLDMVDGNPESKFSSKLTFTTTEKVKSPKSSSRHSLLSLDSKSDKASERSSISATSGNLDLSNQKELLYPFKITQIGKDAHTYTLYASSEAEREAWKKAIVDAKRAICAEAYAQNREPFKLQLLSDTFAFLPGDKTPLPVLIDTCSVARALNLEGVSSGIVSRTRVHCMTQAGKSYHLYGADDGVWFTDNSLSRRSWVKVIKTPKVVEILVVESFNLLLVISNSSLIYYVLDEVISLGLGLYRGTPPLLGRRLNRRRKVIGCRVAFIKDRLLILYQQQEATGSSRTLKAVEPIKKPYTLDQNVSDTPYLIKQLNGAGGASAGRVQIDCFREVDRFTSAHDLISFTPLNMCLLLHTSSGFEYLNLDYKVIHQVPHDLKLYPQGNKVVHAALSAAINLTGGLSPQWKPLSAFRASANCILLCYAGYFLICGNDGSLRKSFAGEFTNLVESAAFFSPYLIGVSSDLIEIWNIDASGGDESHVPQPTLSQIITGKCIKLLGETEGQVRFRMAHPVFDDRQVILELIPASASTSKIIG